jgi:amidase
MCAGGPPNPVTPILPHSRAITTSGTRGRTVGVGTQAQYRAATWRAAALERQNEPVTTFITRLDHSGSGPRIAVKDLIDVIGVPTTAGCKAVADSATPAERDAPCLAGARAAGAVLVGKANLHELAFGGAGVNQWFGTPVNPLDPGLLPGGSSSGSAVAVGEGAADIGYGTDTGGSVRIPSAFCGVAGLKTTFGRISTDGVWPLSPSLDTVGPIAADIAGLVLGMELLEPGFTAAAQPAGLIGRLRPEAAESDPRIDAAVDAALRDSGLEVVELGPVDWVTALRQTHILLASEAAEVDAALISDPDRVSEPVLASLRLGAAVSAEDQGAARLYQPRWQQTFAELFAQVDAIALPTMPFFAPPLAEAEQHDFTQFTAPVNLAGLPALALPVRSEHRLPASLQLIGPANAESLLLATGKVLEAAAGFSR